MHILLLNYSFLVHRPTLQFILAIFIIANHCFSFVTVLYDGPFVHYRTVFMLMRSHVLLLFILLFM